MWWIWSLSYLEMTLILSLDAPTSSKVARVGEVLCLLPLSAEPASVDKQGSTTVGGLVMQKSANWEPHWFSWQWLPGICTGAFVSCQPEWNVNHSLGAWSSDHCTLREGFCLCLHTAITRVFGSWKPYFFVKKLLWYLVPVWFSFSDSTEKFGPFVTDMLPGFFMGQFGSLTMLWVICHFCWQE